MHLNNCLLVIIISKFIIFRIWFVFHFIFILIIIVQMNIWIILNFLILILVIPIIILSFLIIIIIYVLIKPFVYLIINLAIIHWVPQSSSRIRKIGVTFIRISIIFRTFTDLTILSLSQTYFAFLYFGFIVLIIGCKRSHQFNKFPFTVVVKWYLVICTSFTEVKESF